MHSITTGCVLLQIKLIGVYCQYCNTQLEARVDNGHGTNNGISVSSNAGTAICSNLVSYSCSRKVVAHWHHNTDDVIACDSITEWQGSLWRCLF